MILPVTEDRDSGPFFAAAAKGKLVYRACTACDRGIHPPTPFCPDCGGDGEWREASGNGHVHCSTVVTHAIHPDYPAPYTIMVVELEDNADVRLLGHMANGDGIEPGTPVSVFFQDAGEGVYLPNWRAR